MMGDLVTLKNQIRTERWTLGDLHSEHVLSLSISNQKYYSLWNESFVFIHGTQSLMSKQNKTKDTLAVFSQMSHTTPFLLCL